MQGIEPWWRHHFLLAHLKLAEGHGLVFTVPLYAEAESPFEGAPGSTTDAIVVAE